MRVWLVEEGSEPRVPFRDLLGELAAGDAEGPILVGSGPLTAASAASWRASQAELLVATDTAWPEETPPEEWLGDGIGLVVATPLERANRFLAFAETFPIAVVPLPPDRPTLALALRGALAARQRHAFWRSEVQRLEQRLADRIVVERAKGVLILRLGISEEEAYRRLRLLSRRQRRPIREIAQSLLDAESLLLPEVNGPAGLPGGEHRPRPHHSFPAEQEEGTESSYRD